MSVFLSYSVTESECAGLVESALAQAGLDVFTPHKVQPGSNWREAVWRALAESSAVVVVISPRPNPASNITVELGAAWAWHKAVYVVQTEDGSSKVPEFLQGYPLYPIARVDDLVQAIQDSLKGLSKKQQAVLCEVYRDLGIPTDRLLHAPVSVEALAREFNARSRTQVSGERLVQEIVRIRKSGGLPRLGKPRDSRLRNRVHTHPALPSPRRALTRP